ncbi:hypothetical protein [Bacillus thuringiensis]|uniref:hypothetical protein n=1 Tax=Bacillus thuringiensis TaxID=1428 RepID=UPI0021D69EA5|nr:hypothetical protein [Bacillus thuringiensis]MCU7666805.1 hypothetical protein [Bacillus thuringiensis]
MKERMKSAFEWLILNKFAMFLSIVGTGCWALKNGYGSYIYIITVLFCLVPCFFIGLLISVIENKRKSR